MVKECTSGRVTIPTDVDVVQETLDLVKRWGADANPVIVMERTTRKN